MNNKFLVLDCKTKVLRRFIGRQFIEAAVLNNDSDTPLHIWLAEIEEFRKGPE